MIITASSSQADHFRSHTASSLRWISLTCAWQMAAPESNVSLQPHCLGQAASGVEPSVLSLTPGGGSSGLLLPAGVVESLEGSEVPPCGWEAILQELPTALAWSLEQLYVTP